MNRYEPWNLTWKDAWNDNEIKSLQFLFINVDFKKVEDNYNKTDMMKYNHIQDNLKKNTATTTDNISSQNIMEIN